MWMSETPSLCASMIMLLSRRTSELSLCSIGFSSSPALALRSRPSFSSDCTSWSVVLGSGVRSKVIGALRSSFLRFTAEPSFS